MAKISLQCSVRVEDVSEDRVVVVVEEDHINGENFQSWNLILSNQEARSLANALMTLSASSALTKREED